MQVLFVHDGPLYRDGQKNYYGIHYNDKLIERYLQLGTHVTFMCRVETINSVDTKKYSLISSTNFNVIEVPNYKSFSKYFAIRPKAKKIIKNTILEHDIIITRLPSSIGNISVYYAQKYGKPLLTEMVACTLDAYWYHSFKGKLIAYYSYLKQKRINKKIDYCIYVTKYFLQKRYPIRGKAINCSNVQINNLDEEALIYRLSKIKNRNPNTPIILGSIGTVSIPYKGHKDVIKAISILKQRGFKFEYQIVGQGDSRKLKQYIKKKKASKEVLIRGALKHIDIFNFIDAIDIYIHPSHTEGLPRAPIEAMSRACPVIGSDAGGTPELLSNDFIYKKKNISQLVKLLSEISEEKLLIESNRSFYTAKDYQKSILDQRRIKFYKLFLIETSNEYLKNRKQNI